MFKYLKTHHHHHSAVQDPQTPIPNSLPGAPRRTRLRRHHLLLRRGSVGGRLPRLHRRHLLAVLVPAEATLHLGGGGGLLRLHLLGLFPRLGPAEAGLHRVGSLVLLLTVHRGRLLAARAGVALQHHDPAAAAAAAGPPRRHVLARLVPAEVALQLGRRLLLLLHLRHRIRRVLGVHRGVGGVHHHLLREEVVVVLVVRVQEQLRLSKRLRLVGVVGQQPVRQPRNRLQLARAGLLLAQRGEALDQRRGQVGLDEVARRSPLGHGVQHEVGEEEFELAHGAQRAVAAVRGVLGAVGAVQRAQARGRLVARLERVGGAHQRAPVHYRVRLCEAAGHNWPPGHKPHEPVIERLALVLAIELPRALRRQLRAQGRDHDEAGVLRRLEDGVHLPRAHRIGLDHPVRLLQSLPCLQLHRRHFRPQLFVSLSTLVSLLALEGE
mmetsp:Transcript_11196/g.27265  ORF Transcript_11196/g.27265 Transcript_11196/m.27265 type:complete len:437 (+) Transcript_11196:2-1312(+)